MKRYGWLLIFNILLSLTLIGCGNGNASSVLKSSAQTQSTEIIVSAAASLKDSLTELEKEYVKKNPSVKITFNFGSSGTLQQQIEQGAPADLFISAGKTQIDSLDQKNLLVKESITNLLGN
ncbi:MAG: molybdate ABC transporter substrate-binding protein, partial [Desulfitobacterium hafniense]|nr:molybdate ABC transporter substrate-binding protein [Desulfitobacterium hafniense]